MFSQVKVNDSYSHPKKCDMWAARGYSQYASSPFWEQSFKWRPVANQEKLYDELTQENQRPDSRGGKDTSCFWIKLQLLVEWHLQIFNESWRVMPRYLENNWEQLFRAVLNTTYPTQFESQFGLRGEFVCDSSLFVLQVFSLYGTSCQFVCFIE